MKLEVYDPPMCCSSGVCGPNVNPALVKFSSDLEWLKTQNVDVVRYNLSANPAAFASCDSVKKALTDEGNKCLPIIIVNGTIISKGGYPSRDEMAGFLEIKSDETVSAEQTQTVCGPGCDCGKPSGNKKLKTVVCFFVLLAACGILVYKAMVQNRTVPVNTATAFAAPLISEVNEQKPAVKAVEDNKKVGEFLDSLASLNKVAANQDAVFVFIPAKGTQIVDKQTSDAIASARQKIESNGAKLGLYTLQSSSPEYANIAAQLTPPCMLVMSKGRGMGTASGGITEEKLLQAYVASSRAGGCGPSGCGPSSSSCAPSSPSCTLRPQIEIRKLYNA